MINMHTKFEVSSLSCSRAGVLLTQVQSVQGTAGPCNDGPCLGK